jgi:hypothetical protein
VMLAGEAWTAELTCTLYSQTFSTARAVGVRLRVNATSRASAALMVLVIATISMAEPAFSLYPCGSDSDVSLAEERVSVFV